MIKVEKLSKSFDNHIIFDEASVTIADFEMVAIIGESGSGKSTFLNILGMLQDYDDGKVIIFDHNIKDYNSKQKREILKDKIGFLFQNYALIENETVKDNLIIPIRNINTNKQNEMIDSALQKVGLLEQVDFRVNTLSGGEQQRVALARLLLKSCDLILADEPTGNLDNDNKEKVFEILKELNKMGKTVVLVTHDKELANRCDRVLQIKEGKIAEKSKSL